MTATTNNGRTSAMPLDGLHRTRVLQELLEAGTELVRSQVQIGLAQKEATGRRLTVREAIDAYGEDLISEVATEGSATLIADRNEPAATLRSRRQALGITPKKLASYARVPDAAVEKAEQPGQVSPIRVLEALAQALALDERLIGYQGAANGDAELGVRLRELSSQRDATKFSERAVLALAEAAWVIAKQTSLAKKIGANKQVEQWPNPSSDYAFPTWEKGYRLAARTRELLGLNSIEPIPSLRNLIEVRLGIPLVQLELGQKFAGATIANGDVRGIAVNVQGMNQNVWVRRMTLGHELGHLLWDPNERLNRLTVDQYADLEDLKLEGRSNILRDVVEMRANAFAVAFLAPPDTVRGIAEEFGAKEAIIRTARDYGISASAATAHVANVTRQSVERLSNEELPHPSDEWQASENFTLDFFPIASVPLSRRGRFVIFVVKAINSGEISLDSGASLLRATTAELLAQKADLAGLYDY